ncbi:Alpha/Beta hydrolase protein [Aspergillus californicus]
MLVINPVLVALQAAAIAVCASASSIPEYLAKDLPAACDATCQAALAADASAWVQPDINQDRFYDTPQNFSEYEIGDLVKWEDVNAAKVSTSWLLPSGLSLSRFFYVSEDINGKPLPATGYAIIPYSNPLGSKQPFRVVVWAHGTAGFTPQCAPSNNKALMYAWQAPYALAQQGYVVIAPDYAGQGSHIPTGFLYNAGIAHAGDVSWAVTALRSNFPQQITHQWVVVGHSEGGLTAWRTAEREAIPKKAAGGFLGAVSIAPALEVMSLLPWVIEKAHGGPLQEIFLPFMLQTIRRLFPSFDITKYVTDKVVDLTELAYTGCVNIAVPLLGGLTLDDMYFNGANFPSSPEVKEWTDKYHGQGAKKLGGPLLVLHGEKDFILPHTHIEDIFVKQCKAFPESAAEYQLLPGLDHDGVLQASHSNYLPWIADRFDKKPVRTECVRGVVKPATDRFSTIEQVWVSAGQVLVQ